MSAAAPWALCLAGPTASGKTSVALALARRLPVEVISVDSALVYRRMDIGTAKPSLAERAQVPHHLVDIVEPHEPYSAARFVEAVPGLVREIRARGRLPLLVGGSMLYFKALRDGLDALPPADAAVRAAIDAEAAASGWPALHAQLLAVDPATAARLPANDAQRIQRALEVWRVSGRPLSYWHGRSKVDRQLQHQRYPLLALVPAGREWLHRRIAARFDDMLGAGLLDEVRALRADRRLTPLLPAMRCVGYRQAWDALDRQDPPDLAALRAAGVAATRQLAKRQLTWLRSTESRAVVAADADTASDQALGLLASWASGAHATTDQGQLQGSGG